MSLLCNFTAFYVFSCALGNSLPYVCATMKTLLPNAFCICDQENSTPTSECILYVTTFNSTQNTQNII